MTVQPKRCATPNCGETNDLVVMPGAEGLLCAACKAEVELLRDQIATETVERDRENERRRIE